MSNRSMRLFGAWLLVGSITSDGLLKISGLEISHAKIAFLIGTALLLMSGIKAQSPQKIEGLLFVYFSTFFATTIFSTGLAFTAESINILSSIILGLCAFAVLLRSKVEPEKLAEYFFFWISLGIFVGFIQAFTGQLYVTERFFSSTIISGAYRASGLMNDPNYFALLCLLALSLSLTLRKGIFLHWFFILGIAASGSRSAILSSIILITLYYTQKFSIAKRILFLAAVTLAGFVLITQFSSAIPSSIRMIADSENYSGSAERNSLQDRMIALQAAFTAFKSSPLIGYGTGNLIHHPININQQRSHNTFIEILAENGLIGAFALSIPVLLIIHRSMRRPTNFTEKRLKTSALFLVISFALMSMTLVTHYSRIFFFIIALAYLLVNKSEQYRRHEAVAFR